MKYDYFIFDLDGTLLDTSDGIFTAIEKMLTELNVSLPTREDLRVHIGPQLSESFNAHFGYSGEELETSIKLFRHFYEQSDCAYKSVVYEGNFELLEYIKQNNKKMGVATFKLESLAYEVLENFKLRDYFDAIGGSPEVGVTTKPELIESALKKLGCTDKSKAVMIGDTKLDGEGANGVGIDFIACDFGFGNVEDLLLCKPVHVSLTPLDIIDFIK